MEKQPAQKSYVFDKGFRDIADAFSATWRSTFTPVSKELRRLNYKFRDREIFTAILSALADIPVFTVITLLRVLFSCLITLVLLVAITVAAVVVYVGFILVWLADLIYRAVAGISSRCPNCQDKFALPVYICPNCGAFHTRLIPSVYGIFKRKCLCGKKLPTTFFNGRHKLEARCPSCSFLVRDGGKHKEVCIPLVGGPAAGKTCYINMALSQLERSCAMKGKMKFEYAFNSLNDYSATIDALRNHRLPDKTGEMRLQYYQFYLTPRGRRLKRLMSICDVSGELYHDSEQLGSQIAYRYANAFMVIIDPLSIAEYRAEVADQISLADYSASTASIDEILNRLTTTLENMFSASSKAMLRTNVAVVFTKCDIPGLSDRIGATAVARYRADHKVSRNAAVNTLCEDFLRQYGEDNFVNNLRSKFKSVQYFTCSALGRNRSGSTFTPEGVEEPILWLYKKIF